MGKKRFIKNLSKVYQKGQSVVEFVLLMAVVASLAFFMMTQANQYIAKYWEFAVNFVVHDDPGYQGPDRLTTD